MLTFISAKSQSGKWIPGRFMDVKGNTQTGFMRIDPSGKGPVKDESFIEFRENSKAKSFRLSASELKYFIAGRDSFIVANVPGTGEDQGRRIDFVQVVLNEDIKLYAAAGDGSDGSHGGGFSFIPEIGIGAGFGTGGAGFGAGFGGGISIPLGGRNSRGYEDTGRVVYFYGENTDEMKPITNFNFADVMTDIMGDYPDVVDKIVQKVYVLGNIDKLIAYYRQVEANDKSRSVN